MLGRFDEVELSSIPADMVRAEALGSYLVDAVDLEAPTLIEGMADVIYLPHGQAVSRSLGQPARIGTARPLDNLRAAERWWFA